MAANAELQKKLAKRRAGEQVFEKSAAESKADAVFGNRSGVRMEGGWEAVFESVVTASPADVVYSYGQVALSAGSSAAFAEALARIQAFERGEKVMPQSTPDRTAGTPSKPASGQAAAAAAKPKAQQPTAEERQADFKSAIQERFAALLKEGLSPNEAAAQAIREATIATAGHGEPASATAQAVAATSPRYVSSAEHPQARSGNSLVSVRA
jgi:hypothetical protein